MIGELKHENKPKRKRMISNALKIANSHDYFVVDFEEYAINSPNSVVARLSSEALSLSLLADSQRCDVWRRDLRDLFRGLIEIAECCVAMLNDGTISSLEELFEKRVSFLRYLVPI